MPNLYSHIFFFSICTAHTLHTHHTIHTQTIHTCNRRGNLPEIGPAKSPIFQDLRRREVWAEMRLVSEAQVAGSVSRWQPLTCSAVRVCV